jgi:ribosomal protein S12 methylthiotransferase
MIPRTFHMVSLGCAKNSVDSQSMIHLLSESGYQPTEESREANILIVNTCGFICPAIEESLHELKELAANKTDGQVLVAAGCLSQRLGVDISRQVPGIDGILGTRRWMDIVEVVESLLSRKQRRPIYHLPAVSTIGKDERGAHRVVIQGGSAYLKISDGCRRPCAFCSIPSIKGPTVSRPIEDILDDARYLQDSGVREMILIAQDTTDYGNDLGLRDGLAQLLERLTLTAPEITWIRIMYTYPGFVTDRLVEFMASNQQIVPYLDMPLQHAHPSTLRRMRRPDNIEWVSRTVGKMRAALPGMALRTTFIVGYPGETEEEFQTLLNFLDDLHFDRVGAFQFSLESGTASQALGDPVPVELKQERYDRLMERQQAISLEKNLSMVGKTLDVLVEGSGDGLSIGRTYRDAPEIDGLVIVQDILPIGEIYPVRITGAMTYDLSGVLGIKPDAFPEAYFQSERN